MVLPWPGDREWRAPQPMARTSASRTTPTERSSSTRPARPPGGGLLHPALGVGGQRADGSGARARAPGEARLRHRDGALEPVLGIRAQLVGDVVGGGGGAGDAGTARRPHHQLVPAQPVAVGRDADVDPVVVAGIGGGPGRAVPGCVPQHLEAALAGPDLGGLGDRRDGDPPSVDLQLDLGGALAGAGGGVGVQPAGVLDGRALAEGRGSRPCRPPGAGRARRRWPRRAGSC